MKTITLSLDEKVLAAIRRYAAARARRRIKQLSKKSTARQGTKDWTRSELHQR